MSITEETDVPFPGGWPSKLDEEGVLLKKIPYTEEWDYYFLFIGSYGLRNLRRYKETGDEGYKDAFLTQVDFLQDKLVERDGFAVWEHHYSLPWYEFDESPWVHGLAQSRGMKVLIRAHELTENPKYLESAKKVFRSFEVDIEDGGAKYIDENGYIWLEEYAIQPPPHVLNGFISILTSIEEFYDYKENSDALRLWNEGIKTLKDNLERYEIGYWSLYDLISGLPSTSKYHNIHIKQLNQLYELTDDKFFLDYANQWERYKNSWLNKTRKTLKRGLVHLKTKGKRGCIKRYFEVRRWESKS